MRLIDRFFCLFLSLFLLFGCSSSIDLSESAKEQLFYKLVGLKSSDDINNNMTMEWSEYMTKPYHPNDDIWVDVNIKSRATPLSATNMVFSFFIFHEDTEQWEEVENQVPNNYNNLELYPVDGVDPLPLLLMGIPDPEKLQGVDIQVRVFCSVEILEDGVPTGKKMSSFMDIEVIPEKLNKQY